MDQVLFFVMKECAAGDQIVLEMVQATANRAKGNHSNLSKTTLVQRSAYCVLSGKYGLCFTMSNL
jgi:hypothetical protein